MPEFQGSLECGEIRHLMTLVRRLADLPEFGMGDKVEAIGRAVEEAERLEQAASKARLKARELAVRLLKSCQAIWTPEEIAEATGYED